MSRSRRKPASEPIEWKVHVPHLLSEILCNSGAQALETPLRILGSLLHDVAARAAEIDDPALNLLMLRLTMYEAGDPDKHSATSIAAVMKAQRDRQHAAATKAEGFSAGPPSPGGEHP